MEGDISKSILITGYASGLGKELALQYIANGCSLLLLDVQSDNAFQEALRARASMQQKIQFLQVDICEPTTLKQQIDFAVRKFGVLDLCVHCAGILISKPFTHISHSEFEQILQVNIMGTRNIVSAVIPHLTTRGQIGLIASMAGLTGVFGYSAYSASKFAVVGMAKSLQLELRQLGIDVSLICPPSVDTPMVEKEALKIHPATKALKDMAGTLKTEEAVAQIIAGLAKRKALVIPGTRAKFIYYSERFLPSALIRAIGQKLVGKHA
ncbi:SDR family NAD(P)-dependent oxidoreductase [Ningiella sp. W23]|uniref:SDR family NAD(P)-dependent oxidoreductase n=1 Tax=Ningiella sp. W23 TaxID=3023715 RepID=UPI0039F4C2C7